MSSEKTTRWSFTAYEAQWPMFESMPMSVAEWGWQTEICEKTQRLHYQGYIRTKSQVRFSQLQKELPGVHLEVCGKNTPDKPQAECWKALVQYCKKADTAVPGTQKHQVSAWMNKLQFIEFLAKQVLEYNWKDMMIEEIERLMIRLGNEYVLEGNTYAAFILSDPNFTTTIRRSIRAILHSLDRQTDRQRIIEITGVDPQVEGNAWHGGM